MPLHFEERLENLPDRLAESLGRVLHPRRLQRKTAIPRRRRTHAPVIEAMNDSYRQQHDRRKLGVNRNACSSSHSETKPLSGGRPAIASVPTSPSHATHGIRWINPPSFPRLRSFVECSTDPVTRNNNVLKKA